ncbi:MAG TPA: hypothetical protein VMJ10_30210 [Kofleriaceae bacterium]|nr:hypothetical protein [Kofleriaceae bacterium]
MAELTREQFKTAVSDAVTGILNVYREVDTMLRELGAALGGDEPRFVPLIKKLVPGAGSKNPDARYLRNYHAAIYALADESEEDEDEEEEEEGEDEEGDGASPNKKTLTIQTGGGIIVARATVYQSGSASGFEPSLVVGALTGCRLDTSVPPGTGLKLSRSRFRKLLRVFDGHLTAGKQLKTGISTHVIDKPKEKHKLIFDVPASPHVMPLFDVTPAKIQEIAAAVRKVFAPTAG